MQRLKKRDQRRGFRRTQILAVRGHIAAALDHLPNQLILRQTSGHGIQSRSALSALIVERVGVVALLELENESALSLERSPLIQKLGRDRDGAPRVHHRTPWRILRKARKCSQRNSHE